MEYRIVLRERFTFLNALGNPVQGYRVTFEMADGTVDYVNIPEGDYDPDHVRAAITDKIERHQAVAGLGA